MFYLTTHSTHFIYGYMASDIWLRTILIVREETRCRHIGYSFRLAARVLLYAPSHRQDSTYHSLCYTSRGALAGRGNSSISKMNSQVSVKSIWNRIRKIKGKESSNTIQQLAVNDRDVMSHGDIVKTLADNVSLKQDCKCFMKE